MSYPESYDEETVKGPTMNLVVINIAVYFLLSIASRNFFIINGSALEVVGLYNKAFFQGSLWQIITSLFVHLNLSHLGMNMLFLLIFGFRAEEIYSDKEIYLIYLTSGILGNVLTLFIFPLNSISAGASGSVYGVLASIVAYERAVRSPKWKNVTYAMIIFLVLSSGANVNVISHVFGAVGGYYTGKWLSQKKRGRKLSFQVQEDQAQEDHAQEYQVQEY
ncbi:MAG: rhomboid family intramembrane serine protease [Candidatus Kariarchaeaceae archaeon]